MDEVVSAMMEELESERDFMTTRDLRSIYFGGGTPSLLSVGQVGTFMERISSIYNVEGVEEVTLEANPDDLSLEYLRGLRSVGVNRLSVGVQSFDDGALKFMNRRHTAAQALRAIEDARRAGFDNVAIDIIFGVDGFGGESLRGSLERAVSLGVEHIAAYHLTIEEGTMFWRRLQRGDMSQVAEEVSEQEFDMVREVLLAGGYEHYEISNYAKPGRRSIHNSAYWRGDEYLGIGAGAHSFSGMQRRWGRESLDEYLSGDRYCGEELNLLERRNEVVMTSLRCSDGLDLGAFAEQFGDCERDRLLRDGRELIKSGELVENLETLSIPQKCFLRSDAVIEKLFCSEY